LQNDPEFRYASAGQTGEVLEAWLAKTKTPGSSSGASAGRSVILGDERGGDSGYAVEVGVDTISNRGDDTLAGKSGSSVTNLSASDSGVLVRRSPSESDASSKIDLEMEIARRSQSRAGSNISEIQPTTSGIKPIYVVGLAIMFLFAVLLGVFIAKLTTPPTQSPKESETGALKNTLVVQPGISPKVT